MKFPYDLIVFDLESNQPSDKVIDIGAVKYMRDGSIEGSFSQLVKIDEPLGVCMDINVSITELTGITEEMLSSAPPFSEAMDKFYKWATEKSKNVVLASWGNYDTPTLMNECKRLGVNFPFRRKFIDLKSIGMWVNATANIKPGGKGGSGLTSTMKAWGLEFEGKAHRALPDALNSARLMKAWADSAKDTKDSIQQVLKAMAGV